MIAKLMKRVLVLATLSTLGSAASAQTTINFNDGTLGGAIGGFYASLGVNFQNAQWDNFVSTNEASVGAGGLKLVAQVGSTDIFQPKVGNPIVALFDSPLISASIRGLNVGANGARVDAYNALVGGSLVAFQEMFGISQGIDNHPLLSVAGAGIRRLEFYQPATALGEGLLFDNLTFTVAAVQTTVPEPGSLALVASGVLVLVTVRARRARRDRT